MRTTSKRRKGNYKMLVVNPGEKFGMLTVIKETDRFVLPSGQTNRAMLCKCDCGNEATVRVMHLTRGRVTSCGCIKGEQHGMSDTPLYNVWRAMHTRCADYGIDRHRYKDRGISTYPEWDASFLAFRKWALSNGYADGLQIDRIDNAKGYSPDNCRFVTMIENMNNRDVTIRVDYKGRNTPLKMLLREMGMLHRYSNVFHRMRRGWSAERAIDTPERKGNYKRKQ